MALKKAFLALFITILVLGTVCGYTIENIIISDHLNEDHSIEESLFIQLKNNTRESFSFTFPENAYSIFMNGKTVIVINNSAQYPLACEKCSLNISYKLDNTIKKDKDAEIFSRTLNFPKSPVQMEYTVYLTPGYIIEYNPIDPSIVPSETGLKTDGKHIIITWLENSPGLPKRYFVRYKNFEDVSTPSFAQELTESPVLIIIIMTFVFSVIFGLFLSRFIRKTKKRVELPYVPSSLLNPDEKTIINKLKENKNKMNQKELVKSLDWSKSKVSSIVTNLEYKKIVKREKFGRNYKVELVKEIGD
jgi:uncharacterized membrane protein